MLKKTIFLSFLFLFASSLTQAQNVEVYVSNINLLVPTNGYVNGDEIRGEVEIKNFDTERGYDNLIYSLKLVGQYTDSGFPRISYDEKIVGEISILAGETKKLDILYKLPDQIPDGAMGLSAELSLSSGGAIAKKDIIIPLKGGIERTPYLSLKEASISVNGEKFNVGEGPTVNKEDKAFVEAMFINSLDKSLNVFPVLKIWDKNKSTEIILEKKLDSIIVNKQSIKDVRIDIPFFDNPAVYEGEIFLSTDKGQVSPKIPFRYIIQGDIISIHDLSSDIISGQKGDIVNVYLTYSGSPSNIQTNEEREVNADVEISIVSDRGEIVGSHKEVMSLEGTRTLTVPISLEKNVRKINSIQAQVIKEGKVLSQLSSVPLIKVEDKNILDNIILMIALIVLAAIIGLIIRRKEAKIILPSVLLLLVLSIGILKGDAFTLTIQDDPKSSWGEGSLVLYEPMMDQEYLVGETIEVSGRFSDRRCENYIGTDTSITIWISNSISGSPILVGKDAPSSLTSQIYDSGHEYGVNNDFAHNFIFTGATALKEKIEEEYYALGGTIGGTANCGSAANKPSVFQPSYIQLCGSLDIASAVTCTSSFWRWTCTEGFSSVSCTAPYTGITGSCAPPPALYDGVCGSADGGAYETKPSSNLCQLGTSSSVSSTDTLWTWNCTGTSGVKDSCSAAKLKKYPSIPVGDYYLFVDGITDAGNEDDEITHYRGYQRIHVVTSKAKENGTCFTYLNPITQPPLSNELCTVGYPSTVSDSETGYNWTCDGRNGGTDASCSVAKAIAQSGSCGTSAGVQIASQPDSGLCTIGTASSVTYNPSTRSWDWSCSGVYGGSNVSCSAPYPSGTCGPGEEVCDGGCVLSGTCTDGCPSGKVRCNGVCVNAGTCSADVFGEIGLDVRMSPSITDASGKCTIDFSINGDPTNVICTLNGSSIDISNPSNWNKVSPGDYVLSCTNGQTTESASLSCKMNPIFKEF